MMGQGNATRAPVLRLLLWRAGVPVVAVAGGLLGGYVILPWGLVTPLFVPLIFVLASGAGAIALVASLTTWRSRGRGGHIGVDGGLTLILAAAVLSMGLLSFDGTVIRAVFGSLSAVAGVGLSVSVGIAAVALGVVLARRRFRDPEKRLGSDAAVTLGLAGLPAPVFFGAYYTVSLLGLTSG